MELEFKFGLSRQLRFGFGFCQHCTCGICRDCGKCEKCGERTR